MDTSYSTAIPDQAESPVVSVVNGTNADLIVEVARLYIPDGSLVRDVTWGKGAFWKGLDTARIKLSGSDVAPHIGGHGDVMLADFRDLPDLDGSADIVVLDPPYIHNPGKHQTDSRYNNANTTSGMYHADIRTMYREGMAEAMRVLRPGGLVFVKGKDEIESGRQCWSQTELLLDAQSMGLYGKDVFVLIPTSRTSMRRWDTQKHARKVHSFLWVFEKPIKGTRRSFHVIDEDGYVTQRQARRPHKEIGGWCWV
ncbi:class I SAM-dependent methyltransferase [Mycolicibacter icosiumassiliensis]|uniref:class I SAM-dependent methyltransferase n=1 Tax=Mycolicibacter icosiumassiliensis TaxID=1792835 RepID=UPI0008368BE8|nr:class I SAM-dependent methyltransferase [Mycolicibacter icosiumassiliensis]